MNPKGVNDLDPKLKETYERIMGTNFAPTPPQNPTQKAPIMQTQPIITQNQKTENSQQPSNNTFSSTPEPPISVFTQSGPVSAAPQSKKLNVLPIILVFGGIIFIVVYIIVWAKVFGLF